MTPSTTVRRGARRAGALVGTLVLAIGLAACGADPPAVDSTSAGAGSGGAQAAPAGPDRTVARTDVDGDGRADAVYYRVRDAESARVVVRTGDGDRLTHRLSTELWPPRGQWHGAAALDGAPGAELVVGTVMGAHTPMFTVLTYRSGGLTVMDNPAGVYGREWPIDAFYNGYLGWTRTVRDGQVRLALRSLIRTGSSRTFTGEKQTFRWTAMGWRQTGTSRLTVTGDESAARVGGWHVDGLPRWADTSGGTAA